MVKGKSCGNALPIGRRTGRHVVLTERETGV
jgi:hypothetical protein